MKQQNCRVLLVFLFFLTSISSSFSQISKYVEIGGALRFNYRYKAWDESNRKLGGDIVLDVFRLNAKASYSKLFLDAEYRFYNSDWGGGMLHHGFIGYHIDKKHQIQLGVPQVPFGILPYASHSFFFNLPYYVGLEDDYDTGIKYTYTGENWDIAIAYFKNAEGGKVWKTFSDGTSGYAVDPARYSYDLAGDYEEIGQANIRVAYKTNGHEIGVSGKYGTYLNHAAEKDSKNPYFASAIHYHGKFLSKKQLDLQFELINYQYKGGNSKVISMAAYNYYYNVAKEATIITGGLAYTFPIKWKFIESVQVYNDYNYMLKSEGLNDTQMNVTGLMVAANPVYVYFDYAIGKNQDWLGPWGAFGPDADKSGFGYGEENPSWNAWFNINLGYYF